MIAGLTYQTNANLGSWQQLVQHAAARQGPGDSAVKRGLADRDGCEVRSLLELEIRTLNQLALINKPLPSKLAFELVIDAGNYIQ